MNHAASIATYWESGVCDCQEGIMMVVRRQWRGGGGSSAAGGAAAGRRNTHRCQRLEFDSFHTSHYWPLVSSASTTFICKNVEPGTLYQQRRPGVAASLIGGHVETKWRIFLAVGQWLLSVPPGRMIIYKICLACS